MAAAFADCNGNCPHLAREDISSNITGIETIGRKTQTFWSPSLRNAFITEAEQLLTRTVYHLCAGKNLVRDGKLTWAKVTFYYASFNAAHALVRLHLDCPVRIGNRTYGIVARGTSGLFSIRLVSTRGGAHKHIWTQYDRLYRSFPWGSGEYHPIIRTRDYLWDMTNRQETNYDLAVGYHETGWPSHQLNREVQKRFADVLAQLQPSLSDADLAIEARAQLRAKLLIELLDFVASGGQYPSFFSSRRKRRYDFVQAAMRPCPTRDRLLSWLA
ncbi:MAG TPA: hypothetical protein VFT91_09365 [Dehalococcoidia bacterium]|nr:hypothetical protein [Dehalococcoidia bacterium]